MRHRIVTPAVIIALACCLTPLTALAYNLGPRKVLGRYQQFIWNDLSGLPQNSVSTISRTRDGYLWLGTVEGAVRFDGVRFTVFDSTNTEGIRSSNIQSLMEDRDGGLWMATYSGGVTLYRDGRFTHYGPEQGLSEEHTTSLAEDGGGGVWVGTGGGGLNLYRDGRFAAYTTRDGLPDNHVWALAAGRDGALWVGTRAGLARFEGGRFTPFTRADGLADDKICSLYVDGAGTLWAGSVEGYLSRFEGGRFKTFGPADGLPRDRVTALRDDGEGGLWVGTYGGLVRFSGGRFRTYGERDGLPENRVLSVYPDAGRGLWVGTNAKGLIQLKEGRFEVYTTADGLSAEMVMAVYEGAAGDLWVGTDGGLNRLRDGKVTVYTTRDGLPSDAVGKIAEDAAGNLWVGSGLSPESAHLSVFDGARVKNYSARDGLADYQVTCIHVDRGGGVWVGTRGGGLNLYREGRFQIYTPADGLPDARVWAVLEDREGGIWVGTSGGLARYKDGRFQTYTARDGLASGYVLSLYEDREGALWVGTEGGGLSRMKGGRFATITAEDGLYDNVAFSILEDDAGNLWMSCNKGIYRASLRELNDFADGRIKKVSSFNYGVDDGMHSRECNGGAPAGWKTRDGRLLFATIDGVVVVDPRKLDSRPPLVAVEAVTLDRTPLPANRPVEIRPGEDNLEIQYTGLSWDRPRQIKFKYKMDGLDKDWVEAGTRRTAYYTRLPPGEYTFRVIADNGEGVWNTEGRSLRVSVVPPFYLRVWFWLACVTTLLAAASLLYRERISRLERKQEVQEAFSRRLIESQERERKRIAGELHDSIGQLLLVIKNRAYLGAEAVAQAGAGSKTLALAREQLDEISESAAEAINQAREISYNLRPLQLERLGLTSAVAEMLDDAAASSSILFDFQTDQLAGVFPADSEINFFRIVQESVNNIVKHSGATRASVHIKRGANLLRLTVEDNGKGFDPSVAEGHRANGRGLGLTGIAERVRMLGGELSITTAPGGGTRITFQMELKA